MADHFELVPVGKTVITEFHAWIGINRDGEEGILCWDLNLPKYIPPSPLMATVRQIAEDMRVHARAIQDAASKRGMFLTIELRTFTAKPTQ